MSAPIAGNQYFTNVENLLGSLTQLNVANLKSGGDALVANNFSANGVVLNVSPNLTNLAVAAADAATTLALVANNVYLSGFTGAGALALTLPEAAAGSSIVIIQDSVFTGTTAPTFTTTTPSGSTTQDVFAAGQKLLSATSGTLSITSASAGTETILTFTPSATDGNNVFGGFSRLVFTCVKTGEWNVTQELKPNLSVVVGTTADGAFAFS
jgi:hypothetical protein